MEPLSPDSELDDLLTPTSGESSSALRERILRRTTRRIRVRARTKTAMRWVTLAACFLGGMGTLWLVRSEPAPVKVVVVEVPQIIDAAPPSPPPLSPEQLEVEAEKTLIQADSARHFREAGDRYLKERGNYEAAIRCYRNFFDLADPNDLRILETDSWLLMSLKQSRQTEVKHAYGDN